MVDFDGFSKQCVTDDAHKCRMGGWAALYGKVLIDVANAATDSMDLIGSELNRAAQPVSA